LLPLGISLFFNKNKICFLIPARGGSKGIINKNLKKINGLPLVDLAINFALHFVNRDNIFLSSDSKKILKRGINKKISILQRPRLLSHGKVSDIDLILATLKIIIKKNPKLEYLVYLQPTSPMRKKIQLKKALEIIEVKNYDSIWSITKIDKKFHPLKLLDMKKEGIIKLYSNKGRKIIARQQLGDFYIRNGIFYIFRISKILKHKSIYLKNSLGFEIKNKVVNIDNLEDLKLAQKLLRK
jgi:CMP-N,N'-diacetyllegionaminic acid synthase